MHIYITPQEFTVGDLQGFENNKSYIFVIKKLPHYLRDDYVKGGMKDIVFDSVWMVDLLHLGQAQGGEGELVSQRGDGEGAGGSEGDDGGGVDADIGLPQQQAQ